VPFSISGAADVLNARTAVGLHRYSSACNRAPALGIADGSGDPAVGDVNRKMDRRGAVETDRASVRRSDRRGANGIVITPALPQRKTEAAVGGDGDGRPPLKVLLPKYDHAGSDGTAA
jgi:hypothetical protein